MPTATASNSHNAKRLGGYFGSCLRWLLGVSLAVSGFLGVGLAVGGLLAESLETLLAHKVGQDVEGRYAWGDGFRQIAPQAFQRSGAYRLVQLLEDALREIGVVTRNVHLPVHLGFNGLP